RLDLRYVGQFHPLTLSLAGIASLDPASIPKLFHRAHLDRYGHNAEGEAVEATAFRVTAVVAIVKPPAEVVPGPSSVGADRHAATRRVMFDQNQWIECSIHRRSQLALGEEIMGPAVIEDVDTNIVLRTVDRATVLVDRELMIEVGGRAE